MEQANEYGANLGCGSLESTEAIVITHVIFGFRDRGYQIKKLTKVMFYAVLLFCYK